MRIYKEDLIGKTFGMLTVVRLLSTQHGTNKRRMWLCKCSCGKEREVVGINLKRGNSTSCGCKFLKSKKYNFIDLTGKKFSSLLVLKKSDKMTKTRGAMWECQCDCGKLVELSSNALTSGNNKTCSDIKIHPRPIQLIGEIPLSYINAVRQNAIKRNLPYEVSNEYLWSLFIEQNKICQLSGVTISFTHCRKNVKFTASLDRINANKGYIVGNVRWVHKHINIMKWKTSDDDFLMWNKRCVEYANSKQ